MPIDERGAMTPKTLQVFFLADTSSSMFGGKIAALNRSIEEAIGEIRAANEDQPMVKIQVRAITFADGAQWRIGAATDIDEAEWEDVQANGLTDFGKAIELLSDAMTPERFGRQNLPPVLILLSDGLPTDDWESPLNRFNGSPWGQKNRSVRVAIGIGEDSAGGYDRKTLERFTGNAEAVFEANNTARLRALIRWASVSLSSQHSQAQSSTALPINGPDGGKDEDLLSQYELPDLDDLDDTPEFT